MCVASYTPLGNSTISISIQNIILFPHANIMRKMITQNYYTNTQFKGKQCAHTIHVDVQSLSSAKKNNICIYITLYDV